MDDIENRTLTFTFDWWRDHINGIASANILINYSKSIEVIYPWDAERALQANLDCKVKDSEGGDYTKIIFESEDQLTEFLLKYG